MNVDKIIEVISDALGIDEDDCKEDMTSNNTEEWTSLNHLRLIMGIEEEFDVKFTMEELNSMTSFSAIVAGIDKHKKV